MTRLLGRVRTLERAAGLRGQCPACEGRGTPGFEVWMDGERQGPERRGCRLCGQRGVLYRLGIDDPEHDAAGATACAGAAS